MKFNENLKYLRKKQGLTQEELAEKLNVSRQSVTKWEAGQALPDIETIKQISFVFSVSVDCLIGDVENKTDNKMKKRIDDIGWFIFAFVVVAFSSITSVYNFLSELIPNEDITHTATVAMSIIAFITFVITLKAYLKGNTKRILDMKDDRDGRTERIRYIVKKYIFIFVIVTIFNIIDNMGFLINEKELFINNSILSIVSGFVFLAVLGCFEYVSLEKKVKSLNK